MPLGGGRGGALRIGAGMGGFVGERGVVDAVAVALERGEGGRSDGAGGIARTPAASIEATTTSDRKGLPAVRPAAAASALDGLDPAAERETRARAGRADESDQERRLRVGGEADLGQRPRRLGGAHEVGGESGPSA